MARALRAIHVVDGPRGVRRYGYTQPQKLDGNKANAQTPFGGHGPAPQLKNPSGSVSPQSIDSLEQRQFVTGGAGGSVITKGTQRSPDGHVPPQVGYCAGPHVKGESVVVVVVSEVDVVVVVDVVAHSAGPHASQQLVALPTQPPARRQRSALRWMLQREPCAVGRQQVTAPGRPHVARRTQRVTAL
jgi:hypothetical protein